VNHEERARKWLERETGDEYLLPHNLDMVDSLAAQFAEVEAPWLEKDRVTGFDPRRAAIFDWLDKNPNASIKSLSDTNGEFERENIALKARIAALETALEKADELARNYPFDLDTSSGASKRHEEYETARAHTRKT